MDDPWDWDVDRVVQELCSANRSWQPSTDTLKFPPAQQLKSSLLEQEVNGFTLLTYNHLEICRELGFKTLRHKAELQYVVNLLRSRSQRYRQNNNKRRFSELEAEDDETQVNESDGKSVLPTQVAPLAPVPSMLEDDSIVAPAEPPVPDKRAAKRARVAPQVVSPYVDSNVRRNIPTEADVISRPGLSSEDEIDNDDLAYVDAAYLGKGAYTRIDLIDQESSEESLLEPFGFSSTIHIPYGRQLQVQQLLKHWLSLRQESLNEVSRVPHRTKSDMVPGAKDLEHDELLPLYGDSDEEYDSDTWEEIEAERRERLEKHSQHGGLGADEVQAVIEDTIQQFISEWKSRKLAKLANKANTLWVEARKFGLKRSIDRNRRDFDACETRLTKFCNEIMMQDWRSVAELKSTALILQQTVEDKEYFSSVLGIITAPVAPAPPPSLPRSHVRKVRARKPVKPLDSDEEILTSDSEGEIDDFIVDDEPSNSGVVRDGSPMDLDEEDIAGAQQQDEDFVDPRNNATIDLTHSEEDVSVKNPRTSSKSRDRQVIDLVTSKKTASKPNGSLSSKKGSPSTTKKFRLAVRQSRSLTPSTLIMSIDDLEPKEQTVAKELAKLDGEYISRVFKLAMSIEGLTWLDVMRDELIKHHDTSKGSLFAVYTLLRLFEVYKDEDNNIPHSIGWYKKLTYEKILEMMQDWKEHRSAKVNTYIDFIQRLSDRFDWEKPATEVEDTTSTGDVSPSKSPATKRRRQKKFTRNNKEAENLRETDRARVAEQAYRRDVLRKKLEQLEASGEANLNDKDIIINESKADDQGLIFIHHEIAPRIKEHQVGGVRFMWDQIVSSATKQGCLLAHTMGLGKTMQIITLLVAIAEAARSDDPNISSQIPDHLKESRTLIICPPSVVDNWMDELLFWAPEGHKLGNFYKIGHSISSSKRQADLLAWDDRGGVIIFGYTLFTDFMNNPDYKEILSDGPNLVVADEAHMLKNPQSQVHHATAHFKTHSRIALTGSPLANKVEEYHAMINWVAPNYLSNIRDFRIAYANPIKEGLSADSTHSQRRTALKMLKVLKEEVATKVQRVTTSVLKTDIPTKKEFVLTVPLTEVQRAAYETFIRYHQDHSDMSSLASMDTLSVICAHPSILMQKLQRQKPGPASESKKVESLPSQLVSEEITLLHKTKDLNDHALSWKILILLLILEECKRIGDTVLIFSQSILALDYLERVLRLKKISTERLDGSTPTEQRQGKVKQFNKGQVDVFLISTRAGGVGLNMTGANRVIVFDAKFNPQHEQQAVGRAYRIGQKKPVYVYRLVCGGTSEAKILNIAIWKMQLASRVVDKKNPVPKAERFGTSLEMPTEPEQKDINAHLGKDDVLDLVIDKYGSGIRDITMMDTFEEEELEDAVLTAEDRADVDRLIAESEARRSGNRIAPALPRSLNTLTDGMQNGPQSSGFATGPFQAQAIVQNGQYSSHAMTNGANTQNSQIGNVSHQYDPMQPIQGATTHIRNATPSQNPTLDILSAEGAVASQFQADPDHLQYALRNLASSSKNSDSKSGQHKPQRLDDEKALEAVMERRKARQSSHGKDPRLPNWAIDAVAKQNRIMPPSTTASSTTSNPASYLSSKSPFI